MVLKKSNSIFNSGTTQRFCNRGAFKKESCCDTERIPSLHITIEGIPDVINEHSSLIEHELALKKVYDYLGIVGLQPKDFYKIHDRWGNFRVVRSRSCDIYLGKSENWNVINRFKSLMAETNFLEGEEGIAEIHLQDVVKSPKWSGIYSKKTCVVHGEKKESSNVKDNKNVMRKAAARFVQQKTRGLQRKSELRNNPHQNGYEEQQRMMDQGNFIRKKVIVELIGHFHMDARYLDSSDNTPAGRKLKMKTRFNSKGWVNGKNSEARGYSLHQIRDDTEFALSELYNLNDTRTVCTTTKKLDEKDEEEEWIKGRVWFGDDEEDDDEGYFDNSHSHPHSTTLCTFNDIIIKSNAERKKAKAKRKSKSKRRNYGNDSEMDNIEQLVNTASSQTTVKHPKGSFLYLDKNKSLFENTNDEITAGDGGSVSSESDDSGVVHFSKEIEEWTELDDNDGDANDVGSDFVHFSLHQVQDIENTIIDRVDTKVENFKSHDNFVGINKWQQGNDFRQLLTSIKSSQHSDTTEILVKGCPVSFGNCFPPVLWVKLGTRADNDNIISNDNYYDDESNRWSLVLRSSISTINSTNCREPLSWEITLKNNKASSTDDLIKDDFFSRVTAQKNTTNDNEISWSLDGFILEALASIRSATRGVMKKAESNTNTAITPNSETETNIQQGGPVIKEVFSLDGALRKLDTLINQQQIETETRQAHGHFQELLTVDVLEYYTSCLLEERNFGCVELECDICFSECDSFGPNASGMVCLLPCQHLFCYTCWQTHIFHSTTKGNGVIQCMHTGCNEVIDNSMLNAFIPEDYWQRYSSRLKDRKVEMDPRCQWCPRSKCDKVAVVEQWDCTMEQFGCSVACQCSNQRWCFSCKANSHWPSSCKQNETYRNILHKIGESSITTTVKSTVDLKPCPECKYPIEKNEGCPSMVCAMCNTHFCWNCLQPFNVHRNTSCYSSENDNFVTYHLQTDLANTFPLKFVHESVEMRKKQQNILPSSKLQRWLLGLTVAKVRRAKLKQSHFLKFKSNTFENFEQNQDAIIEMVRESVNFIREVYCFLEHFYILLSCANLNTSHKRNDVYVQHLHSLTHRLLFCTDRIERLILENSLRQIVKVENSCRMFISNGRQIFDQLNRHVPKVRRMSKDISTEEFAQLDPTKYFWLK